MWGTKEYFAPEVVDQNYGPQADVWALGCVLFEMLSGEQAFPVREHDTESKFYGRIQRGEFDFSRSNRNIIFYSFQTTLVLYNIYIVLLGLCGTISVMKRKI